MTPNEQLTQAIAQEGGVTPCQNAPDIFFPELHEENVVQTYRMARSLCNHCPIIAECLNYALTTNQTEGMWGGLSPVERRQLLRKRPA